VEEVVRETRVAVRLAVGVDEGVSLAVAVSDAVAVTTNGVSVGAEVTLAAEMEVAISYTPLAVAKALAV
jgi:hypothetical protein